MNLYTSVVKRKLHVVKKMTEIIIIIYIVHEDKTIFKRIYLRFVSKVHYSQPYNSKETLKGQFVHRDEAYFYAVLY